MGTSKNAFLNYQKEAVLPFHVHTGKHLCKQYDKFPDISPAKAQSHNFYHRTHVYICGEFRATISSEINISGCNVKNMVIVAHGVFLIQFIGEFARFLSQPCFYKRIYSISY